MFRRGSLEIQRLPALRRHDPTPRRAAGPPVRRPEGIRVLRTGRDPHRREVFGAGQEPLAHTIETTGLISRETKKACDRCCWRHDRRLHDVHQDHRLYYDYNFLDGVHYVHAIVATAKVASHRSDNSISSRRMEFGGDGELYVNGEKVDEIEMPQMHIATYSLAETFDVGRDTGTQVSDLYTGIFEFDGELDRVIITVSDENTVPPRELPANYY